MAARDAESMFSAATEFAATVFSAAKEFAPTAFSAAAECPPSELLVSPLERTAHGGTTTPSTSVPPWPSVQAHARFHHRRSRGKTATTHSTISGPESSMQISYPHSGDHSPVRSLHMVSHARRTHAPCRVCDRWVVQTEVQTGVPVRAASAARAVSPLPRRRGWRRPASSRGPVAVEVTIHAPGAVAPSKPMSSNSNGCCCCFFWLVVLRPRLPAAASLAGDEEVSEPGARMHRRTLAAAAAGSTGC